MTEALSTEHADIVRLFSADTERWYAHQTLFNRRHPEESAPAHRDMLTHIYSNKARLLIEGFRGMAKSTTLEETAIVRACYREFRFMVIVGASYEMACKRLAAIKNEFEVNRLLIRLYGEQRGSIWRENQIVLQNGCCIQAIGRDQSVTGIKYLDWRPDAALIDDVEDPEEVRTDVEREKTWRWFLETFLPSMDHPLSSWVRVLGTRRGSGSLPERLQNAGWPTVKYPIEFIDKSGNRSATWPAKFPLEAIDQLKIMYRGDMHTFAQEYMCQAYAETDRTFRREDLRCEPRARDQYHAVYAMFDPARTTSRSSATTGKAVWSWFGNRLVFWEVKAESWQPDQIINDLFATARRYDLTWLGFEEDGLNEWAKQPIRHEMLRRHMMLPLLPVRAPKGKLDFIGGLQPYMRAGEVTFAGTSEEFKDAIDQFLSYPRGKIDAPNACAYALLLRPGAPVFEGFSEENASESVEAVASAPLYLAGNADGSVVTAALVQRVEGEIRILADWVREGNPSEVVAEIHSEAMLGADNSQWEQQDQSDPDQPYVPPNKIWALTRQPIRWIVPSVHAETYRNVGLVQAVRQIPQACSTAPVGTGDAGRVALASLLGQHSRGQPRLLVSTAARWTLRAFSGGYARKLERSGIPNATPDAGIYKLLMEGLEAFAAVGARLEPVGLGGATTQPVAYDRRGVPYPSAMPARR